jgi:hypothetical protein
MDQSSIVICLNRKGLTAQNLHGDLVATLGAEAIAYSMVTNYLRATRIIPPDAITVSDATSPHIDESDEAILRTLEELPFSSVRQLSGATHLRKTMVYMRLCEKPWFTAHHLRFVPHILFDDQTATRVKCSRSVLTIVLAQETRAWHDIMTLDESWFYYTRAHDFISLAPDGKVSHRAPATVRCKK